MLSPTLPAWSVIGTRSTSILKNLMLNWSLTFFVIAIIAGILGFGGIAGAATSIARLLFLVFVVLFILALVRGRKNF